MTWLWILLIAIVVGGVIGYLTSGSKEGAKKRCGIFRNRMWIYLNAYFLCIYRDILAVQTGRMAVFLKE